jgi:hypothetical protein
MSVPWARCHLSNVLANPWAITVIVILVVLSGQASQVLDVWANVMAIAAALMCGVQQRRTATPATTPVRCRPSGAS